MLYYAVLCYLQHDVRFCYINMNFDPTPTGNLMCWTPIVVSGLTSLEVFMGLKEDSGFRGFKFRMLRASSTLSKPQAPKP